MYYTFSKRGDQKITPQQFGYYSLRWGFDIAKGSLNDFCSEVKQPGAFARKIIAQPFAAEMQFMALAGAAYWICATVICNAPSQIMPDLHVGLEDALNDCRDPSGNSYDKDLREIFKYSFGKYFDAMKHEFANPPKPGSFIPDGSQAGSEFFKLTSKIYQASPAPTCLPEVMLGQRATDLTTDIFTYVMENEGLEFHS